MYALVVNRDEAKAEQIVKKFSMRVVVKHGHSTMFLYPARPVIRKVCMKCRMTGTCPLGCTSCPAERARDEALIGLRALEYAHVKARIIFPA